MTTAVKAIYVDGVFKPQEPVALQEKTEVQVLIPEQPSVAEDPSGWKEIDAMVGSMQSGRGDVSENHDQYLYGKPRG